MNSLALDNVECLLVVGAHADDIEIGCGGTVLALAQRRPGIRVHWVVLSGGQHRAEEARRSADAFLADFSESDVRLHEFTDGFFPAEWSSIKKAFETIKTEVEPDLILTHHGEDAHQDHRVVSDLTWNTFRNHFILEYEIPKYDGDLGRPNVFVPFDDDVAARKCDLLLAGFPSQATKAWFDKDVFAGLMRLRGMECAAPGRFAEAFHARKICLV